jgi:hypothetical protein
MTPLSLMGLGSIECCWWLPPIPPSSFPAIPRKNLGEMSVAEEVRGKMENGLRIFKVRNRNIWKHCILCINATKRYLLNLLPLLVQAIFTPFSSGILAQNFLDCSCLLCTQSTNHDTTT